MRSQLLVRGVRKCNLVVLKAIVMFNTTSHSHTFCQLVLIVPSTTSPFRIMNTVSSRRVKLFTLYNQVHSFQLHESNLLLMFSSLLFFIGMCYFFDLINLLASPFAQYQSHSAKTEIINFYPVPSRNYQFLTPLDL